MKDMEQLRFYMVEHNLAGRGITDQRVLDAMAKVPRELFVPVEMIPHAYEDRALSIGEGQTISQPWIVAYMTQALELLPSDCVLEIGTGSGYQAAILGELVHEVYTVERLETLAASARSLFERCGCRNIQVVVGDGTLGLAERGPFDAIIVTAASPGVPAPLKEQLKSGGRMIIPLQSVMCEALTYVRKTPEGLVTKRLVDCRFVPLIGRHGYPE